VDFSAVYGNADLFGKRLRYVRLNPGANLTAGLLKRSILEKGPFTVFTCSAPGYLRAA